MAEPIHNPPSAGDFEDDDNDDLFVSAIGSQNKKEQQQTSLSKEFNNIHIKETINERAAVIEDINLNDDDDLDREENKYQPNSVTPPVYREDSDSESNSLTRATISPQSLIYKMNDDSSNNGNSNNPAVMTTSSSTTFQQQTSKSKDEQFIEIRVVEPKKSGDGIGAYVTYKVITKTNLPFFRRESFTVSRRFSDFLGLREKLADKYLYNGRIVPPAPSKQAYNTAKVKMAKDEVDGDFLEKRAKELERFMNRIGDHQVLRADPDFREFLELETELPKATGTSALSSAGVKRLFSRVGETMNKMTYKMDETDPWYEEKQQQVDNLDQQLRKLHASVEALIHHRKELTSTTGQFSKSIAMLGNCEEHTSLSCALSQLAETEEKLEQLYGQQVNSDFYYLAELVKDYINLIGVVKDVFHNRVKVFQTWQNAQQTLAKKRENKLKFEISGKGDKVSQANEEIAEWEAKVNRGQEDFENISKTIKIEFEKLEISRIKDFKKNIVQYMESLLDTQQKIILAWENFLPETKAIA